MRVCKNQTPKLCEFCGEEFVPLQRSDQKYCSYRCGQKKYEEENRPITEIDIVCDFCQTEFRGRSNKKFCTDICKEEWHKLQKREANKDFHIENPLFCDFCKEEFIPRRRRDERFCSDKCKTDHNAAAQRKAREEIRAATILNCPICSKQFTPKKTLKEIYCSPYCRKAIGRRVYKMMATCYASTKTKKADHAHKVLGYTPNQLLAHLQSFATWETLKLGAWHLDHVFPIMAFVRRGIKDLKLICALSNLQPLPGSDNCSKNDVYDEQKFEKWLLKEMVNKAKL